MEKLLSVGELFKRSFEIYKKKFWTVIILTVLNFAIFLPLLVCVGLVYLAQKNVVLMLLALLVALVVLLGAIVVGFLLNISLFIALISPDEKLTIKQYLTKSLSVAIPYTWISFLTGLIIFGGLILFIIPGIIFGVWFCLGSYILVKENVKGWQAMKKSKELIKGYGWAVFGRFLCIFLLIWILSYIPFLGPILSAFFLTPLFMIFGYLIYEDLKRIKSVGVMTA